MKTTRKFHALLTRMRINAKITHLKRSTFSYKKGPKLFSHPLKFKKYVAFLRAWSGGRNTAQNKPELEDEIDPLTPSSNQASESNKIHL